MAQIVESCTNTPPRPIDEGFLLPADLAHVNAPSEQQAQLAPDVDQEAQPEPKRMRLWLTGIVAYEPRETPSQGQPFANWARSRLSTIVGIEQPKGYTGIVYETVRYKAYPDE